MKHATRGVEMVAPPMAHLAFAERALGTRHPSTGVGRPARALSHAGRRPERQHRVAARCVAQEIQPGGRDGPVLERRGFGPIITRAIKSFVTFLRVST